MCYVLPVHACIYYYSIVADFIGVSYQRFWILILQLGFYFIFAFWLVFFISSSLFSHSLRQQQSSPTAGRLASKGKFYNVNFLFTTFMARKAHEMAHVSRGGRTECCLERFKCLTDYRLELWLVKDSVYLSCIAVNEFIFDSLDVWVLVVYVVCCLLPVPVQTLIKL